VQLDRENEYLLLVSERQAEPICGAGKAQQIAFKAAMIDEMWEQLQLPGVLEEYGADLYHNPCFSLPVVRTTSRRVATVHDVVFRARPELVDPWLRSYLDRWTEHALEVADAIITSSEFSKGEIIRCYGTSSEKIYVIYHGIHAAFRPRRAAKLEEAIRRKHRLPERFVLYVGALEAKKNVDGLLEAFALLVSRGLSGEVGLVLVGGRGGRDYDAQPAVERMGIKDRVTLAGYVADEEVVALMNMAALFVYPSLYEGFGLPPLEAMACGAPTVVSDASSLPEIVGDGALIAPNGGTEGLANAMHRLLSDPELRRTLSERGRKRAETFTWERAARKTLELYESLNREDR
jgi:glycosyltransferase involved in cell wall biosynthesis